MPEHTILIAATSSGPRLDLLAEVETTARILVGNSLAAFGDAPAEATILFNWSGSRDLLREIFLAAPHLQWVHSRMAGLDATLFPELIDSPIPLTNGSGVFSPSLGEFALLAMLYFAKYVPRLRRQQANREWSQFDVLMLSGATLGIVGYGDIGKEVALRAHAFGMNILAFKRHAPATPDPLIHSFYQPGQLHEMLALCDYIVVAAPLTPETHHLIGPSEFAIMKPSAVIINVGRGPIIDEAAMTDALTTDRIRGAGLDVFEQEPLPPESPLYALENVFLSPHCADNTADWLDDAVRFFAAQYQRFRQGEPLKNLVNKNLGY